MKNFIMFAYVWMIVIGGYMFLFTSSGKIIKICIACNSMLTNILAVVSIVIGLAGLVNSTRTNAAGVR